jgi:hypothetical protein
MLPIFSEILCFQLHVGKEYCKSKIKRLTRTFRENSSISEVPVLLDWLRSLPSLFDGHFIAQLITESAGEPLNWWNLYNYSGDLASFTYR